MVEYHVYASGNKLGEFETRPEAKDFAGMVEDYKKDGVEVEIREVDS